MGLRIVTADMPNGRGGVPQFWRSLVEALRRYQVGVAWDSIAGWEGNPAEDLILTVSQEAVRIPNEYVVIATQHGSAMEHGLRNGFPPHVEMGKEQIRASRRPNTFWVACSASSAYYFQRHTGLAADRIIWPGVDVDAFFPSERQMRRETVRPVVLHHCVGADKGSGVVGQVAACLGDGFEMRRLDCAAEAVPDAMREADMFLCLSKDEGAPTVVQEALASNLLVVGTDVGILWSYANGDPIEPEGLPVWLNRDIGAAVFDWKLRDRPSFVAATIRGAWEHRATLNERQFALRWFGLDVIGHKWVEAIGAAMARFKLGGRR